jgi:hypothetical protein
MREERERLQSMTEDRQQTWDLSPNDVKAIKWALGEIDRLDSDLAQTARDVMTVIDGEEPDDWAWPLYGIRDALITAREEGDRQKARADAAEAKASRLAEAMERAITKATQPEAPHP